MSTVLFLSLSESCGLVAYADDIALITHTNELEYKISTALNLLNDWVIINKLFFSPTISKCLLMKGSLVIAPVFKLRDSKIKFVNESICYSVIFDDKLSFSGYIGVALNIADMFFFPVGRLCGRPWCLGFQATLSYMRLVFWVTLSN